MGVKRYVKVKEQFPLTPSFLLFKRPIGNLRTVAFFNFFIKPTLFLLNSYYDEPPLWSN
jgi:hypothetical protein